MAAGAPAEDAHRYQVVDLPEERARVTEYRLWRKRCPRCGGRTRAKRPAEATPDAFGSRLKAVVTLLSSEYRLSRREVVQVIQDLFGVDLSVGSVQGICEGVSEAVSSVVADVKRDVERSCAVHADETGWRQKGNMRWLWAAVTQGEAVFQVEPDRGRSALSRLLNETFDGIVTSDRWRPYDRFEDGRRQLCHAHLRRDFQAAIDRGGVSREIGEQLLGASNRMFEVWHASKRGEMDRDAGDATGPGRVDRSGLARSRGGELQAPGSCEGSVGPLGRVVDVRQRRRGGTTTRSARCVPPFDGGSPRSAPEATGGASLSRG